MITDIYIFCDYQINIQGITSVIITRPTMKYVSRFPGFILLDLNLLSNTELYSCPPSKGPIGSALKMPTLKLINQSQKNIFAKIGKLDPKMGE